MLETSASPASKSPSAKIIVRNVAGTVVATFDDVQVAKGSSCGNTIKQIKRRLIKSSFTDTSIYRLGLLRGNDKLKDDDVLEHSWGATVEMQVVEMALDDTLGPSLVQAVLDENYSSVHEILGACADPNQDRSEGLGLLATAAHRGLSNIVGCLCDARSDVNKQAHQGYTPFLLAAEAGYLEVLKCLLEHGANRMSTKFTGDTALFLASENGHVDVVRYLCGTGIDIDQPRDIGATPLLIACEFGRMEVAKFLCEQGAQKNAPRDIGACPLLVAAQYGHTEIVRYLCSIGAEINLAMPCGCTPLIAAAAFGRLEVCSILLACDADINAKVNGNDIISCDGDAAAVAEIKGHSAVSKLLSSWRSRTLPD